MTITIFKYSNQHSSLIGYTPECGSVRRVFPSLFTPQTVSGQQVWRTLMSQIL